MSFFERLRPKPTPKRRKRYAVSPHDNVQNFERNLVGTNAHRYLNGKSLIKPIYKDEPQRAAAHRQAREWLESVSAKDRWVGRYARLAASRNLPRPRSEKMAKIVAYTDLYQRSRKGASRMNFGGITDPETDVQLFAHGAAGYMGLTSDTGEIASVKQVAEFFARLGVPENIRLKINACYGAAGRQYNHSSQEIVRRYRENTLKDIADVHQSFGAALQRVMARDLGFRGPVYSYLGNTSVEPMEVDSPQGVAGRHMVVGIPPNDMPKGHYIFLRKRDARIRFIS